MAYTSKHGIRYESTFDSILKLLSSVVIDAPCAVDAAIDSGHQMLAVRPREEVGEGQNDSTFAHLRLEGSVSDARRLVDAGRAAHAPAPFIALLQRVLDDARRALSVAQGRRSRASGPTATTVLEVQSWARAIPTTAEREAPIVALDLEASDI